MHYRIYVLTTRARRKLYVAAGFAQGKSKTSVDYSATPEVLFEFMFVFPSTEHLKKTAGALSVRVESILGDLRVMCWWFRDSFWRPFGS